MDREGDVDVFELEDDDDDADWGESFEPGPRKDSKGATIVVGLKANPLDREGWDEDFLLEDDEG